MAMRFRTARRSPEFPADPHGERVDELIALTYELLDAHADTARLGFDASDAEWDNHLAYLRDLQRVGREALARAREVGGRAPTTVAAGRQRGLAAARTCKSSPRARRRPAARVFASVA
jgi:hypothetical protein